MNAVGARHMFWQAPPLPFLTNGPFKTVPLRMSGRHVLTGGIFLSQANGNRLNGLSIASIIGRIQIQPGVQAVVQNIKNPPVPVVDPNSPRGWQPGQWEKMLFQGDPQPKFPPMTQAEKETLLEISKDPTNEELKDLATIDDVFSDVFEAQGYVTTLQLCYFLNERSGVVMSRGGGMVLNYENWQDRPKASGLPRTQDDQGLVRLIYRINKEELGDRIGERIAGFDQFAFMQRMTRGGGTQESEQKTPLDVSFKGDKFYCTNSKSLGSELPISSMFALDSTGTWGLVKQATENALIVVDVHKNYPFPPPVDTRPELFWKYAAAQLPKTANIFGRVDPEAIRAWMTLATLQYYDPMSKQIQQDAAAAAAAARRRGWLMTIIGAIVSVVLPFLLPLVLVSAIVVIKTIITTIIDARQRQAAAKALADTSKMFEKDAPAFAAEVQKTADMMDASIAQEEAAKPLTPEQQSIVQDIEKSQPGTSTGTYVAGGVVAAGALAALVALLR